MKQSLITLSVAALFGLTSLTVSAASHGGAAPMAGAASASSSSSSMAAPTASITTTTSGSIDLSGTKEEAKAMEKKADADYKAAKKQCKEMKGDEEKTCMKEAKAVHAKAKLHAEGIEAMAKAKNDEARAKVTAKYQKKMAEADMKAMK